MSEKVKQEAKVEETKQPTFVDTLLLEGTVTLTAKTRDELSEMVNSIPAEVKYGAGAVGQDFEHGVFTLQVSVINHQK